MKKHNKGFMLAETLIVTMIVSGMLIFLFIQFTNLSKSYEESFKYNTTENLFSLNNFKSFFESNEEFLNYLENNISKYGQIDITNCTCFEDSDSKLVCEKLIELSNIDLLVITPNEVNLNDLAEYPESFKVFSEKISKTSYQKYRMIAKFNDSTFATLRFGE